MYIFCTGLLLRLKSFCQPLPRISSKSCLGSVIGRISKVSSRILSTFSEKNAGIVGPRYIPFIPRESSVISMHTAFCSYHESTRVRGSSFTEQPNASARARATCIALYESLHWPTSRILGIPSISPRSISLNLYLPQAIWNEFWLSYCERSEQ